MSSVDTIDSLSAHVVFFLDPDNRPIASRETENQTRLAKMTIFSKNKMSFENDTDNRPIASQETENQTRLAKMTIFSKNKMSFENDTYIHSSQRW